MGPPGARPVQAAAAPSDNIQKPINQETGLKNSINAILKPKRQQQHVSKPIIISGPNVNIRDFGNLPFSKSELNKAISDIATKIATRGR